MTARRGARRRSEIPPAVWHDLQHGRVASANLVEWMAIDQAALVRHVAPQLALGSQTPRFLAALTSCNLGSGLLRPMRTVGSLLWTYAAASPDPNAVVTALRHHPADTVRGWGAFLLAASPQLSFAEKLTCMVPWATDPHFNVREFSWLALRPAVAAAPHEALSHLQPWVHSPCPYTRRFAVEITRPRGVWCCHMKEWKDHPERALSLLEPAQADPDVYVQDSVANWLNDASKTRPVWVAALCQRWRARSPSAATLRITHRAERTLRRLEKR